MHRKPERKVLGWVCRGALAAREETRVPLVGREKVMVLCWIGDVLCIMAVEGVDLYGRDWRG